MEPGPGFWPDYLLIPRQIAFSKNLQPLDMKVYGLIYWLYSMKEGKCTVSNETMSYFLDVDPNSVQRSLLRLEEKNYIERKFADKKRKIRTEIIPLLTFRNLSRMVPPNGGTVPPSSTEEIPPNGGQNNNIINKNKEIAEELYHLIKDKINPNVRLTPKGYDTIRVRLKTFSVDDLKLAIKRFTFDSWRMKHNNRMTFSWYFKSDDQVEKWLAIDKQKVVEDDLI